MQDALGNVLRKATVHRDAAGVEVLTHERLATSAEEAVVTLKGNKVDTYEKLCIGNGLRTYGDADVGDASVTLLEPLDVRSRLDHNANGFMARNELITTFVSIRD